MKATGISGGFCRFCVVSESFCCRFEAAFFCENMGKGGQRMWIQYNENPIGKNTGDCVLRALAVATGDGWDATYWGLCLAGSRHYDWGNSDEVWWEYLQSIGWKRRFLPDHCATCYTVKDFCREYSRGTYILGIPGHVVAVVDGNYIDTWDSGSKRPLYFWTKEI